MGTKSIKSVKVKKKVEFTEQRELVLRVRKKIFKTSNRKP